MNGEPFVGDPGLFGSTLRSGLRRDADGSLRRVRAGEVDLGRGATPLALALRDMRKIRHLEAAEVSPPWLERPWRYRLFDFFAESIMVLIWLGFLLGAFVLLMWNSALWFVGDLPDWYFLLLAGALARGAISFAADIAKRRFRL